MTRQHTPHPKTSFTGVPKKMELNREKSHQLVWTAAILSFFMIQAVIWAFAITLTAGDRSHAVVHHYDAQALTWDQQQAERESSAMLGWTCEIEVSPESDLYHRHPLRLRFTDPQGEPLNDLTITLSAFHLGNAADVQDIDLQEVGEGVYGGTLRVEKQGKWQWMGQAELDSNRFLIHQRKTLNFERRRK